jgi:Transposase
MASTDCSRASAMKSCAVCLTGDIRMGWTGCFPRWDSLRRLPPQHPEKQPMDTITTPVASIGIDIGKDVFHVVGFGKDGKIAFRRKIKRLALLETFRELPPSVVGMEACLSAHFVSRVLRQLGHQPRIIPAIYVKPFVKEQKNDYNDAEAIAEAALRPNLRCAREDARPTRPPGPPSRSLPPGLAGDDQSDPRLSDRTGHRG